MDTKVKDVGPWRGIKEKEWLQKITEGHAEDGVPALRKGETLPFIKPTEPWKRGEKEVE